MSEKMRRGERWEDEEVMEVRDGEECGIF